MGQTLIPGIPEEAARKTIRLLSSVSPEKIILFGSRATGRFREGSDIDIALRGKDITLDDREHVLVAYPNLGLPWKLDVVVYDLIEEPLLKKHIDEVGKSLEW